MKIAAPSRRSFLKATLAAGATPLLLPGRVWAAETSPNARLRIGVIGIGTMGRGHLDTFLGRKEFEVVAVCDVDSTRRNDAKARVEKKYAKEIESGSYKGVTAHNDFREVIAKDNVDAVVIATPDHWHAFISIAAANAKKDIYCEKPLTQTIHEARALVDAVRKNERVFQTGSQQRSSNEFRIACELVRNGVIGKVPRIETGFGAPGKWCNLPEEEMEPGLDWDLWLGGAPKRPYNSVLSPRGIHKHFPDWRQFREYGSGMITDWGAHHLDIAQWGLGMDESGPVAVVPPENAKTAKAGGKLIYANGTEVVHVEPNGVTFHGEDGMIFVNRGTITFIKGDKEVATQAKGKDLGVALAKIEAEFLKDAKVKLHASTDHKGDWLSCIRSRKRPICDVEVGARTVTACHLLGFGYYEGAKVKWDPAKNEFVGGTGDPKWLTREYRPQWKV